MKFRKFSIGKAFLSCRYRSLHLHTQSIHSQIEKFRNSNLITGASIEDVLAESVPWIETGMVDGPQFAVLTMG